MENLYKEELRHETIIVNDGVAGDFDYSTYQEPWVSLHHITLVEADTPTLISESELMDMHINIAQVILKAQFNRVQRFY